jgi:hypothetical protein
MKTVRSSKPLIVRKEFGDIMNANHILKRHAGSFQNEGDRGIKILMCFKIKPSIFKILMSNVELVHKILGFHSG